jgi:hypothetical protein
MFWLLLVLYMTIDDKKLRLKIRCDIGTLVAGVQNVTISWTINSCEQHRVGRTTSRCTSSY